MRKKLRLFGIGFIFFVLIFSQYISLGMNEGSKKNINSHFVLLDNGRFFLWFQPDNTPPENGYPVILLFHGAAQHAFSWVLEWNPWTINQVSFGQQALDSGFYIICLESKKPIMPGPRAWDVFEEDPNKNNDIQYISEVLNWIKEYKPDVDSNKIYCAGFSSGAFMCSRLALSYDPIFSAMAINSGCNAQSITLTKFGPIFNFTTQYSISKNHPPTLLLHGAQDTIVPLQCATNYYRDLQNSLIDSKLIIEEDLGHIWLKSKNSDILEWFQSH